MITIVFDTDAPAGSVVAEKMNSQVISGLTSWRLTKVHRLSIESLPAHMLVDLACKRFEPVHPAIDTCLNLAVLPHLVNTGLHLQTMSIKSGQQSYCCVAV